MSFHSWLQNLRSALTPGRNRGRQRQRRSPRPTSHRPSLEILEDRCVPAQYAVTDLGTLGGSYSHVADINEAGQVVGDAFTASGVDHGFLWNNGTIIDLGTLGGTTSWATGINDLGQVVGVSGGHAFLITPQGGVWFQDSNHDGRNDLMIDLMLGVGSSGSWVHDINNAGQVVGWYTVSSEWSDGSSDQAFLWDTAHGMTNLGMLLGGFKDSHATGINGAGQVTGYASYYDPLVFGTSSFLWDAAHGMTLLGAGPNDTDSMAAGINDLGQLVGSQWNASGGPSLAFLWRPGSPNDLTGSFADLGALSGAAYSSGAAINNAGQVVGSSTVVDASGQSYQHALLWDAAGGIVDLQNQLLPGSDATLAYATAINDGGAIAVNGSNGYRAYLLTPDSPGTPTIRITDAPAVTEGNAGARAATFTVTLSAASNQTITVAYATGNDTATAGSDYQAASGTLTFAPGETSQAVTVLITGDRLAEPNETFFVNLGSPVNANIADGQGLGTILDDDPPPSISISDASVVEGNSGTKLMTFTVTLSQASGMDVWVNFATANGTAAVSDSDYVAKSGTLYFAPGETTKTITVEIKGDKKKEKDERFFVNLSGAINGVITDSQGVGTILNDDGGSTGSNRLSSAPAAIDAAIVDFLTGRQKKSDR
ncbi:MAG: DUF3466 family protein [Planctomycetes bacterium]|nr:DUF3466 family protein [Planctomycetota bacterium]